MKKVVMLTNSVKNGLLHRNISSSVALQIAHHLCDNTLTVKI